MSNPASEGGFWREEEIAYFTLPKSMDGHGDKWAEMRSTSSQTLHEEEWGARGTGNDVGKTLPESNPQQHPPTGRAVGECSGGLARPVKHGREGGATVSRTRQGSASRVG
ncbi:hypothetical protein Ddc_08069 [Ditylenchus destructor]|nr:hypothetical protein Ddc_08069 [Ditylenchus destructor]